MTALLNRSWLILKKSVGTYFAGPLCKCMLKEGMRSALWLWDLLYGLSRVGLDSVFATYLVKRWAVTKRVPLSKSKMEGGMLKL